MGIKKHKDLITNDFIGKNKVFSIFDTVFQIGNLYLLEQSKYYYGNYPNLGKLFFKSLFKKLVYEIALIFGIAH
jgi:hypothetical protein